MNIRAINTTWRPKSDQQAPGLLLASALRVLTGLSVRAWNAKVGFAAQLVVFSAWLICSIILTPIWVLADDSTETVLAATEALQENQAELDAKKAEIEQLNTTIKELQGKVATSGREAELIAAKLKAVEKELGRAKLELSHTQLSISSVQAEQQLTESDIEKLTVTIDTKKDQLRVLIRELHQEERTSPWTAFLTSGSLSTLLAEQRAIQDVQDRSIAVMRELQDQQYKLEEEQAILEQQEQDLSQLSRVLSAQQSDLVFQQQEQDRILATKKAEQARFTKRIAEAAAARKEIEQHIFTLQGAGVKLGLAEATDMARLASNLTGVRPELLMAVLKVESSLGTNIGNGTFPEDMHPASRDAFLRITARLGLDPHTAPISRAQSYGWGGAMGPAQIMPATWEGIEGQLASLLNKPAPDPYNLTDAFVGTAVILGGNGAFDPAQEEEAVGRYLAGPNWRKYSAWYIERVMAVAEEYASQF